MPQSRPFDPACQRYAPDRSFPPYRHRPGQTPHPRTHPQGHSYRAEPPHPLRPVHPDTWSANQDYLFGVDLFNGAYWWEAHEQWEALWRLEAPASVCGLYLQGLIQIAAALIKWSLGNAPGAKKLSTQGREKLAQVAAACTEPVYMGLDLPAFLRCLDLFLAADPLFSPGACAHPEQAPLIQLNPGPAARS